MTNRWSRRLALLAPLSLAACATFGGREPVIVDVVGVEPLVGQGHGRPVPGQAAGAEPGHRAGPVRRVAITLDVRGNRFASGVSDVRGTVPRFGETVLSVPVTVPVSAMVAQALSLASGDRARLRLRAARPPRRPGLRRGELPLDRRAGAAHRVGRAEVCRPGGTQAQRLGHARDDPLDRFDRGVLRVDVVGDDLAAAHDDDAVDHLEDVVDVVGDEDAGMAGVARVAHEAAARPGSRRRRDCWSARRG